jgi:hypothetical protein
MLKFVIHALRSEKTGNYILCDELWESYRLDNMTGTGQDSQRE